MLEYIFIGAIGIGLLLLYCLINSQGTMCKLFRKALVRDKKRTMCKVYLEHFREHKQNGFSRNIVTQLLPWLGVMVLLFVLSGQYFIFAMVLSGSMEPTFKKSDMVLMQTIDKEVKVGDIVMFAKYGFKEPITHRVVDITKDGGIITKGDANPTTDGSPMPPERIAGKAVAIGNQPIVLKGFGNYIRPENVGEFTVLTKMPKNFIGAQLINQIRGLMPLILFFCTLFYFFILIETRMVNNRRFNGNGKNGRNGVLNSLRNGTKAR